MPTQRIYLSLVLCRFMFSCHNKKQFNNSGSNKVSVVMEATLVAFAKMNGQLYHFKEDIVIQKNNR